MLLDHKVALVTGASRGIGAAIAKGLAQQGAIVIVNYLKNHDKANATVADITASGGQAVAMSCDVRSDVAIQAMITEVLDNFGAIDILVNNAFAPFAFDPKHRRLFGDTTWADFQSQIDGSLKASHYLTQALLPAFKRQQYGRVINITTNLTQNPVIPYHDYIAAKSAVLGWTRSAAVELGAYGIRVNAIAPGLTYPTDASRTTHRDVRDAIIAQTPTGRLTKPADIAGAAVFLASALADNITGQCLFVDGGLTMN